ncbi:MAG: hypothetical protein WC794_01905 [Candidatus Doudnabacteria bacterium]|jgi:ferredoxin
MLQYKKLLYSIVVAILLLSGLTPMARADATPTLSLLSKGDGDRVEVTVNGDANKSVIFYYNKKDVGLMVDSIGTTNSSGYFSSIISSATYNIVSESQVYVSTNGLNGTKSSVATWPNLGTSGTFSLSQTGVTLSKDQTVNVTAYNTGGKAIYVSNNSNPPVANININGTQVSIIGIGYGSTVASICVAGNSSTCASIYITIQNSGAQALSFSVSSVTVTPGQSVPITISGGTGTYTVLNNSNSSVIQPTISGSTITLTTTATSGTSAITVCSSDMSACGIINATAGTASTTPLAFSQTNPTLSIGQVLSIGLSGGNASTYYVSNNSNSTYVSAVISGSALTLTGINTGSATISVCSSSGSCGSQNVTVSYTSSGGSLQLSQTSVSLLVGQVLSVTISGGSTPYSLGYNAGNVFQAGLSGNILSISGIASGVANLSVCSAGGACVSLAVTINSAGAATPITFSQNNLSLNPGAVSAVTLTGAGGYYVSSSSNSAAATAQVNANTVLVTALAAGSSNISICQSGGSCAILFVTVSSGSGGISVPVFSPTAPSVMAGQTQAVSISGGTGSSYYVSANTNPSAAALSISGRSLTISGLSVGSTVAVICSAANSCAPLTISVSTASTATQVVLSPSSATLIVGDILSSSIAGNGGYSVSTNSNSSVATAQINGSTLVLNALAAGSSLISVCQSGGQCATFSVTVNSATTTTPPQTPSSSGLTLPSGTLVNDKGAIYLIVNKEKIPFASMKAFSGLGYSLANVTTVDISGYPLSKIVLNSPTQKHPDGSWIISGKVVFYVATTGYVPVPTWRVYLNNGGEEKFIVRANPADLADPRPILTKMTENDSRVIR